MQYFVKKVYYAEGVCFMHATSLIGPMAGAAPVVDTVVVHGGHERWQHDVKHLFPAVLRIAGPRSEQLTGNCCKPLHSTRSTLRVSAVRVCLQLRDMTRE